MLLNPQLMLTLLNPNVCLSSSFNSKAVHISILLKEEDNFTQDQSQYQDFHVCHTDKKIHIYINEL